MKPMEISKPVLKRLPNYLSYLKSLPEDAPANISATALAAALNISYSLILRLKVQNDIPGFTLGIIVRNYYLVVFAELREDGIKLLSYKLLAFIGGKCNGYFHN